MLPRSIRKNKDLAGTHLPLLTRILDVSHGPMLELGTGYYSTFILHSFAQMFGRECFSYENSPEWYQKAKKLESKYHHIFFIEDWTKLPLDKHFGVVFVDHGPNFFRRWSIAQYADKADYIVAHDSEPISQSHYHLEKTLSTFKYRFNYEKIYPNTSVVSNFYDLSFLKNP